MRENSDSASQRRVGDWEILAEEEVSAARKWQTLQASSITPPPLPDHPQPLPLACPARDEEWSARSPSPLCGRALNGWRSAAPGSGAPSHRSAVPRSGAQGGLGRPAPSRAHPRPPHRPATLPATPLAVAGLLKHPRGKGGPAATRDT